MRHKKFRAKCNSIFFLSKRRVPVSETVANEERGNTYLFTVGILITFFFGSLSLNDGWSVCICGHRIGYFAYRYIVYFDTSWKMTLKKIPTLSARKTSKRFSFKTGRTSARGGGKERTRGCIPLCSAPLISGKIIRQSTYVDIKRCLGCWHN